MSMMDQARRGWKCLLSSLRTFFSVWRHRSQPINFPSSWRSHCMSPRENKWRFCPLAFFKRRPIMSTHSSRFLLHFLTYSGVQDLLLFLQIKSFFSNKAQLELSLFFFSFQKLRLHNRLANKKPLFWISRVSCRRTHSQFIQFQKWRWSERRPGH